MFKLHTTCRACQHPGLIPVFSLGVQPLANAFRKAGESRPGHAPLDVLFCPECTLAQLSVVVEPNILYDGYPYVTGNGTTMHEHFHEVLEAVRLETRLDTVVEIGSNDGAFLDFMRKQGVTAVCGIDPAGTQVEKARELGIQTFCGLFDNGIANMAKACVPPVNLVVARHVLAHIDDWCAFFRNLDLLCNRDTLVYIEVPDVRKLLENVQFDTIYHEHLSFVGLDPLKRLLESTPFMICKVFDFKIHGGSLGILIRRRDSGADSIHFPDHPVEPQDWEDFGIKARDRMYDLKCKITSLVLEGHKVVGYGASAKSSVWLNALGLNRKEIAFVCDCTPEKQGKFCPGTEIPVLPESKLMERNADFAVLFAWGYEEEILAKQKDWRCEGGQFIIPTPEIKVV